MSFAAPPNYDDPADADADNVYRVDVHASEGSATGFLAVSVIVTDLNEPPDVFGPVGVGVEEGSGTLVGAYTYDDFRAQSKTSAAFGTSVRSGRRSATMFGRRPRVAPARSPLSRRGERASRRVE